MLCQHYQKIGPEVLFVGDSHVKPIQRNDFNKELKNSKATFQSFSGGNTKLGCCILPPVVNDKPDVVCIHVGTNDILNNANHKYIARNTVKIGLNCKNYDVNIIAISSILVKSYNLNVLIRHVNNMLRD